MNSGSVAAVPSPERKTRLQGFSAYLFCMMLCAAIVAFQPFSARAEGPGRQAPSAEKMVSRLKERLSLSDEQVKKIQPILEEGMKKQAALRKEMIQLRETTDGKINAVLTAEQKKQFQEMKEDRRGRFRGRMQKPQAPPEDEP